MIRKICHLFSRICLVVTLFCVAQHCPAQLANSGWPKFRGDYFNSGRSVGANVLPIKQWLTGIQIGSGMPSCPSTGSDGTVFVGGGPNVYAFDGVGGGLKWTFTPPVGGGFQASPAISKDGTVYIGSSNPGSGVGNTFYALDGKKGTVKWSFTSSSGTEQFISSPAIDYDGAIYVATSAGNIYKLDPAAGAVTWVSTPNNGGDVFYSSPCLDQLDKDHNGGIYIGSHGGFVYCVNKLDGTLRWQFKANGSVDSSVSISPAGFNVIFGSLDNNVYCVDNGGRQVWSYTTGGKVFSSPGFGPNNTAYIGSEDKNLYAFDAGTGSLKWTFSTGAPIDGSPAVAADGTVYLGPGDGYVYALNGVSGAKKWSYQTTSSAGSPSFGTDGTLYVLSGTSILALESVHVISTTLKPTSLLGGHPAVGTVIMNLPAAVGGAYVGLVSDDVSAIVPQYITVAAGQIQAQFPITTGGVDYDQVATITATPGINQSVPLTIFAPVMLSLVLTPSTVKELDSSTGTVTISGPAGPAGVNVVASTSNIKVAECLPRKPPQARIDPGQTKASFAIVTYPVDDVTVVKISASGLGTATANLTVQPASLLSLALDPTSVVGGNSSVGTVTLDLPAGPSGTVVSLNSSNASARVPATVTVASGDTTASFTVTTTAVAARTTAQITANLRGVPKSLNLGIKPVGLASVSMKPAVVFGSQSVVGTVTLDGAAPAGGMFVTLTSDNQVATVPASVTVPEGQTSVDFAVQTILVSNQILAKITGTHSDESASTTLTVNPATPTSLALSPESMVGGDTSTATVTLNGPAGPQGVTLLLTSSDPAATVPPTLFIPKGSNTGTFKVTTVGVNTWTVSIVTASIVGVWKSANLSITPTSLVGFTLTPNLIVGGQTSTGVVRLLGPAAPSGSSVLITCQNPLVTVPASVTVPGGQTTATFPITSQGVSAKAFVPIKASLNGDLQAILTLDILSLVSVKLDPSTVAGASPSTGTVFFNGPAGPGGVVINLASDQKAAQVPATISVPAGQSSGTFTVLTSPVTKRTSANISASLRTVTVSAALTMNPIGVLSVSVNPTSVVGGNSSTGVVTLTGIAPKGGTVVRLSSTAATVASVPGSVTIPAGSSTATFVVKTFGVASEKQVPITGKLGVTSASSTLTVKPAILLSISVNPATVTGGSPSTGTVTLSGAAPTSGMVVTLSSTSSSALVPAKVTVSGGKTTATFVVKTTVVVQKTSATISASLNGTSVSSVLTLNPISLLSVTLNPSTVVGGKSSTATVTLSGPAPSSGVTILCSSDQGFAKVPATVNVASAKTSATFTVATTKVDAGSKATISCSLGSLTVTAVLTTK